MASHTTPTGNEPTDEELRALVAELTLDEKLSLVVGEDFWSLPALPRIGLRKLRVSDGPVGVRGVTWDERDTSLLFPSPTALAAAWDPEVTRKAGAIMGAQTRDKDIHVLLAPTVNLHRSPLGGRHFECYSEDPLLTAKIATAFIEGVQSAGVGATIKHFVGNETEDDRMSYDSRIDERSLREVYLVPFEEAVRSGRVWLVMSAYNQVNGQTMTENQRLVHGVLKDEWDFDGVVISDWMAVRSTEAAADGGGTDIAMPGPTKVWGEPLLAAVREGRVPESRIDERVERILRLAARVGVLGDRKPSTATTPGDAVATLRAISAQAMVLLGNDGTLPLDPSALSRVALIGANALRLSAQGGGSAHVNPSHVTSIPEGLRAALGGNVELTLTEGAFTHRALADLAPDTAVDPVDGEPGLRAEFLDADGNVLKSEHRLGSSLMFWPDNIPEGSTVIRLRVRITPTVTGTNIMDVRGAGRFELTIDGVRSVVDSTPPEGTDVIELIMRPEAKRIEIEATAGTPVDVSLDFSQGSRFFMAALGLGWSNPRRSDDDELDAAVEAARAADVAVVVVGTTDDIESEGFDRKDLALPGRSDELVRRVAAANPKTVVVVNAGSPVLMPWRDEVAAVVWAWLPGQEGGAALADVLTGTVEPGGRLPTTYPAAEADVPVYSTARVDNRHDYSVQSSNIGYRAWALGDAAPAYPFGHGLGYTSWEYTDVAVKGDATGLTVEVTVANTGDRAGREVVQVYLETADGTLMGRQEPIRLVGFAKLDAEAGSTSTVTVEIDARTLARWDEQGAAWTTVAGTYTLRVGRSLGDLRLSADVAL
ncbi:glycoside hydrolase family 3 protein [Streptomyces sp. SID3343]|uniref:beta-glucosidase family protein n=1 Tax=Streptomyces sp. SID3343 TaxID=2690260 RepID=UPI00136C2A29|nr:glycoside hydrolase family 3 protein [Streptomyces sp. SID3343]MYW05749.1 beta-glucosidase [Streptomyces sp. SID3343]